MSSVLSSRMEPLDVDRVAPSVPAPIFKKSASYSSIFIYFLLYLAASVSLLTTIAIIFFLFHEVSGFFSQVSPIEFFFGTEWSPLIGEVKKFGILPLFSGTLMIAVGAAVVACPIGILAAIFLSEYSGLRTGQICKSILEILAGIPTVVYGFFALTFITPHLREIFPTLEIFNALSAALVVGLMIVPTVASISQDAFMAVPDSLRHGAAGLGVRKYQIAAGIVFPAALPGVIAAFILGISRAIGETMAVTLAAGATPRLSWDFFQSIQTMTSYIVQVSQGDTPAGTIEYQSIFAVGLTLFAMTFVANAFSRLLVRRLHERYE